MVVNSKNVRTKVRYRKYQTLVERIILNYSNLCPLLIVIEWGISIDRYSHLTGENWILYFLPGYVPQAIQSFRPVALSQKRPGSAFARTLWTDVTRLNFEFELRKGIFKFDLFYFRMHGSIIPNVSTFKLISCFKVVKKSNTNNNKQQ